MSLLKREKRDVTEDDLIKWANEKVITHDYDGMVFGLVKTVPLVIQNHLCQKLYDCLVVVFLAKKVL